MADGRVARGREDSAPVTPTVGRLRALRIAVLGGSSLLLAVGAHLVGGGRLPSWPVLVTLAVLVGTVAVGLTSRRCRLTQLLPIEIGVQALLHVSFQALADLPACTGPVRLMSAAAGHPAGMSDAPAAPGCPASVAAGTSGMPGPMHMGWTMTLAHLAATLATVWLLARGEALLWGLAERIAAIAVIDPSSRPRRRLVRLVESACRLALRTGPTTPAAPRGPPWGITLS